MKIKVTFGDTKRKIGYSIKTAKTIVSLLSFFKKIKTKSNWYCSSKIREYIKISNTLLWNLAYQGYLKVSVRHKKFKYVDKIGILRTGWCQVYYWKPSMERFTIFETEAKIPADIEIKILLKEKEKERELLSPIEILRSQ